MLRTLLSFTSISLLMLTTAYFADELSSLKNFQRNTDNLLSSALPDETHFKALKQEGVVKVIDLIPGDRSEEKSMVEALGMAYFNIAVDWDNPTLENFQTYVTYMELENEGNTLTHCRLNWRGSAFTYLYRVTQLGEPEEVARKDLEKIWQPEGVWLEFINKVKAHYRK